MSSRKNRSIHFWRKGMLEGLKDLAKVFSVNASYAKFVEFAELREKGLRKSALNTLAEFIGSMKKRPFAERKDFVSLFCETSLKWRRDSYLFSPQPLVEELIRPTTLEWISEEPENPLAFRWAGVYCNGDWEEQNHYFRKATELDPSEDYSRSKIIDSLLNEPDYSTHHLNESMYLGEPNEDLKFLAEAKIEVSKLKDPESAEYWTKEIDEYESMIRDWIEYSSKDRRISFPKFTRENGRDYGWSEVYYFNK